MLFLINVDEIEHTAFNGNPMLTRVELYNIKKFNSSFSYDNGIYNKNLTTLIVSWADVLEYSAFHDNPNLTTVVLNNIETLPMHSFSDNPNLATVSLENIKTISRDAFSNTPKLKEINIPESVTYIAPLTFSPGTIGYVTQDPKRYWNYSENLTLIRRN